MLFGLGLGGSLLAGFWRPRWRKEAEDPPEPSRPGNSVRFEGMLHGVVTLIIDVMAMVIARGSDRTVRQMDPLRLTQASAHAGGTVSSSLAGRLGRVGSSA